MYTTYGWTLLQTVPCLACCGRLDSLAGWHGDDFNTEGEPGALDVVDEMILASFKAKVLPRLGPGANTEATILRRILRWSEEGGHMAPDAKHVEDLASLLEVKGAKPSPAPSSPATGRGQRRCVGTVDSCRGHGVPQRNGNRFVSPSRQVRSAVCDKGTRSRHADA